MGSDIFQRRSMAVPKQHVDTAVIASLENPCLLPEHLLHETQAAHLRTTTTQGHDQDTRFRENYKFLALGKHGL